MRRKQLLILSMLAVGLSLGLPSPTFAAVSHNGATWWSVEELLAFNQEVEQEKLDECGDDLDCQIEFGYNMIERGPEYSALNNFLEAQIWITAVNPVEETVKVLYFDDDMMLKHMGIEEKIHLQHLYMGWFDEWNAQIFNYDHDRFTGGEMPGLHTMYDGSSSVDGSDWIPAWKEVELQVTGSNLKDNTSGIIDYAVFAEDNTFNAQGTFNYSSCLNAPDYAEGVECKLMISGDQWATYLPPSEQTTENATQDQEDDTSEGAAQINQEPDQISSSGTESATTESAVVEPIMTDPSTTDYESPKDQGQGSIVAIDSVNDVSSSVSNNEDKLPEQGVVVSKQTPKVPDTGKSMKNIKTSTIAIPWWIIVLETLGVMLILWWFIPIRITRKKKKQKTAKKPAKTLDKKSQVR